MPTKRNAPSNKNVTPPKKSKAPALRFAHPYFTPEATGERPKIPGHGQRMLDHIKGTLQPIPTVTGNGMMSLSDVIGQAGADAIAAAKQITIHIAGDTGVPETDRETRQVMVAEAMAKDYNAANPHLSPAFFLHLGDVIYGPDPNAYLGEFYRPYMHYPGKIVAIPGNHDGESTAKMNAFQKYFCAPNQIVPPIAGSIFRQTLNQPGVYWCLDAPLVQIVGLYSNSAENPGFISGPVPGQKQKQWLVQTLKSLKATRDSGSRKALLFATHHPPYSSGGHSGSTEMLDDIDDACKQADIMPDAFFSGHAHSIQRYTRSVEFGGNKLSIPYIVSGCAGHGGQKVAQPTRSAGVNPTYELGYEGWGYTLVDITEQALTITSYGVDWDSVEKVDGVTVNLK
jgi:Calcineurin-like phosphoesterase